MPAFERGLRARNIAREIGDGALEVGASLHLGQAYMWRGDFRQSVAVLEDNLAWIDGPLRHLRMEHRDRLGPVAGYVGSFSRPFGQLPGSDRCRTKGMSHRRRSQRPADIALAYWWAGFILSHKGDVPAALRYLEHGFEVCRSSQINYLVPILSTSLGYTYALAGRTAEGIPLLTKALAILPRQQVHLWGSLVECIPGFCQAARQ